MNTKNTKNDLGLDTKPPPSLAAEVADIHNTEHHFSGILRGQ